MTVKHLEVQRKLGSGGKGTVKAQCKGVPLLRPLAKGRKADLSARFHSEQVPIAGSLFGQGPAERHIGLDQLLTAGSFKRNSSGEKQFRLSQKQILL